MSRPKDEITGPVVQKREVLLVAGLIASWILVVYFIFHTSQQKKNFYPPREVKVHTPSKLMPAFLENSQAEESSTSVPMDAGLIRRTFASMKERSHSRPDALGTLAVAEPEAPVAILEEKIVLQEEVIRGAEQQNVADESVEQEGEIFESEPPEGVEAPAPAAEPTKL